jgi:Holliday junction resolvase-like predicted endonuclease
VERKLKHDLYQDKLCQMIESKYDYLETNVCFFSQRKRKIGEIDIIAHKGDICDIYEVKCSYRIVKARKQLKKIKKVLSDIAYYNRLCKFEYKDKSTEFKRNFPKIRNTFFFCGVSETIMQITNI